MTHGALFNGIAGFPLAAQWAGIETKWTVEIDEFCNKVSKKHFPSAIQYTDIHECHNLPYVDIISGGFPCQPFSVAGKQLGNEDDRALWPQMLRVIREVKPAYVIGENVTGIINLALDQVLASLEAEGYTTETFVVPACGVGAPHRRDRVWIVAYANDRQRIRQKQALCSGRNAVGTICKASTDTNGIGLREESNRPGNTGFFSENGKVYDWSDFPTESPVRGANDGLPSGLVRNRSAQLKAYGNAIVPQVAYQIFEAIKQLSYTP